MSVCDTGGRQPRVELQRRFSAATREMELAWQLYRADRWNAELLRRYTRATERCQILKESAYLLLARPQGDRRAA